MAKKTDTDNKKEAKELVSLPIEVFPDFTGERVSRDLRVKDTDFKVSANLPVPDTAEAIAEMYGLESATEVLRIAVKQISYGRDREINSYLKENAENVESDSVLAKAGEIFQHDLETAPERKVSEKTAKRKEEKKKASQLDVLFAEFGVDNLADLKAKMAEAGLTK